MGVVPGEHAPDRLREGVARRPFESLDGFLGIEHHGRHIIGPWVDLRHRLRQLHAEMIDDDVEDFLDRVTRAGRDIEDAGRRAFGHDAIHDREEILHVEKIAHGPRAEAGLAGLQSRVEGRNGSDRESRGPVTLASRKRDERQAGHGEVMLARLLRDAVAREGARGCSTGIGTCSGRP